jgi:membrane-associated phospholipid phosphatase
MFSLIKMEMAGKLFSRNYLSSLMPVTLLGIVFLVLAGAGYLLSNRFPLAPVSRLPMTWIDLIVPFWPATGWIYAAQYPFMIWAFFSFDDPDRRIRFLYACLLMQAMAVTIFLIWPIAYPREQFVTPPGTHAINEALVIFWRTLDAPTNCLPSLHVSGAVLCISAFMTGKASRHFRKSLVCAFLCSASTLTFKQHYFVDVLAGLALGVFCYWIFFHDKDRKSPRP